MSRIEKLLASIPWLSGLLAAGAIGLAAASAAAGVAGIGLDMGARLLFLAILPLAVLPWMKRPKDR